MTPDTRVNAAADKDTVLSVSSPILPSLKDLRAFEHDRQRVKKAADLVKMRARKGQGRWASLAKGEMYSSSRRITVSMSPQKEKRLRAEEVDTLDGLLADSRCDLDGVASRAPSQPSEVKLSDLVTFRKPRKGLGTFIPMPWRLLAGAEYIADGDFVVIPHCSVIVLDDITSNDFSVDEPWEHIYGSDEEESAATTPTKGPSYADILTHAK
ncbi:hypothetical protein C8R43DRAFT_962459 [Mycena crocata]|nr:hypothetical protein C8R43DRAFT_962459 [Mycena crocata]